MSAQGRARSQVRFRREAKMFMKMNGNPTRYFAFYCPGDPCAPDSPSAGLPRQAFLQEPMEDATMPRVKQASTQKRTTKAAVKVLGAAGLGLSLVGGASASSIPTTDIPQSDKTSPNQRFILGEEEMAEVSLATFHLFDRENIGSGVQIARGCGGCGGCHGGGGCRGCGGGGRGCGGCRGCGGGFGGCGFGGCVGCVACVGCAGCCLSWGACRLC
jgi:hypothetical protein